MLCDKRISLDPRLSRIAELVGTCECCADIGSDHGRLGAFLLQSGQCRRMVLTDISGASLSKARKLIALMDLEARTVFCVGNGALAIDCPVDAAVIAGMGGETIASIVEQSAGRLRGARLVLQPNVALASLRRRLNKSGWRIVDEDLVRDDRRIYPILVAVEGEQRLDDLQAEAGPVLLERRPPLLADYAAFRLRVARKALSGAQQGGDAKNIEELRREINLWEEVEACL
ncbi:MAG: class I SAM-dependent methyltransferase [Clostridia bacterium]|nr:class I SAM-dependent methyltransferase [Clostridia bacterium]